MGFLYYIPSAHTPSPETFAEIGLGHIADRWRQWQFVEVSRGPDDAGAGRVVADSCSVDRVGFYPDEQTWVYVANTSPECFVGVYNDAQPGPHDLARSDAVGGKVVKLADGNAWVVPIARGWILPDEVTALRWFESLPMGWKVSREGAITATDVVARFRPLAEVAASYFDWVGAGELLRPGGKSWVSFPELKQGAVDVLGVNYNVSASELIFLGAIDDDAAKTVLNATIGLDDVDDWVKKKLDEKRRVIGRISTIDSGSEAETTAPTGQLCAT